MNGLIDQIMNYVADSHSVKTSGDWRYIIIGNFFIGVHRNTSRSLTISTAVGSVYQASGSTSIDLPLTLTANMFTSVSLSTSQYSVWTALYSQGSSSISYRALSALSRSTATYSEKAVVIGIV